jgi:hypothetical protein
MEDNSNSNGIPKYFVYRYPKYFKFDESIFPPVYFMDDGGCSWDEETGYLLFEDGDTYRYRCGGRLNEYSDSVWMIPWPYEVIIPPGPPEQDLLFLYPTSIDSPEDEVKAVLKFFLRRLPHEERRYDPDGVEIHIVFLEDILDYQLHQHNDNSGFLDYIKTYLPKVINANSIPELRIRNRILKWHSEKVKELQALKAGQPDDEEATAEAEPANVMELEYIAHKVVALHELGIIDRLKDICKGKNPTLTDARFAELLCALTGIPQGSKEAVRKGLSGYGRGTRDDPKTPNAIQKVRSQLMKYGIEL